MKSGRNLNRAGTYLNIIYAWELSGLNINKKRNSVISV